MVQSFPRAEKLILPAAAILSVLIGAALVLQPFVAWFLIIGFFGLALVITFPPYNVACLAVGAVVFSRLLVAWGLAPGFINFVHFPLAVAAAFFAILANSKASKTLSGRLLTGILALAALSIFSWIANGGEWLRPVLTWLLFVEPFLVVYAITKTAPVKKSAFFRNLALGLALVQVPFAFWQAATLGLADNVQGTLIGQGAGAHVVGAITLMGFVALLSESFYKKSFVRALLWLLLLFAVPVLSDAKQVIVAFMFGVVVLLWSYGVFRTRSIIYVAIAVLFVVVSGFIYKPLRMVINPDLVLLGLGGKLMTYEIVLQKMVENPASFLLGLGPANSVSRAALSAGEGYIRSLPSGWVELGMSPVTADILSSSQSFYLFAASSVWSGVSSMLGLFGDLGLIGVLIYSWLIWSIWRELGRRQSPWAYTGRAVLAMGVFLGFVFSWLETPEFTLPWALYMSLGLIGQKHAHSYHPHPLPPTRR